MSREFLWFSEKIFSYFCQGFTTFPFNPAKEDYQNGNNAGRGVCRGPSDRKMWCF